MACRSFRRLIWNSCEAYYHILHYQGARTADVFMIPLILASRLLSLYVPLQAMHFFWARRRNSADHSDLGRLRGAISIALALTLPVGHERNVLLVATYAVVAFSILVQATTMPRLPALSLPQSGEPE